ncbi:MAG: hypothetical protein Q4P24_01005 [Rhodobacterales bacterium]|nr:hypothetical protein [Rhodobacterales bacterium]
MTNGHSRILQIAAVVAVVFGVITVIAGGLTLFGGDAARIAMGDAVPFVLRFNFMAGFAYILAGIGLWRQERTAVWISLAILGVTALVFVAFLLHVQQGGAYEPRTIGAMVLRIAVWAVIARVAWTHIRQVPRR